MKINLDKLKNGVIINKKMMFFLLGLCIIAIITGALYVAFLNEGDKLIVKESIVEYIEFIEKGESSSLTIFKNIFLSNVFFILLIWLLGISVIGIPIIVFLFFSKSFLMGFSIATIILNYEFKGLLFALFYIFPHQIINIFVYMFLIVYACALSYRIIDSIIKKTTIDFKPIINKYLKVLLISMGIILISILFETFLTPILLKKILPFLT